MLRPQENKGKFDSGTLFCQLFGVGNNEEKGYLWFYSSFTNLIVIYSVLKLVGDLFDETVTEDHMLDQPFILLLH